MARAGTAARSTSACAPLPVTCADTDKAGVICCANYLKYLEIGRTELLRSLGVRLSPFVGRGPLRTLRPRCFRAGAGAAGSSGPIL